MTFYEKKINKNDIMNIRKIINGEMLERTSEDQLFCMLLEGYRLKMWYE